MLTINLLEGVPGYLFGPMCPDAGYVPCFELLPYADGVIINYPDNGNWQVLPPFVDQPRLNDAYRGRRMVGHDSLQYCGQAQ